MLPIIIAVFGALRTIADAVIQYQQKETSKKLLKKLKLKRQSLIIN